MKKKIEQLEHAHQRLHKEAIEALRATAESIGITYGEVKRRFVFEQDLEVTEKFWKFFYSKNDVETNGIDYCHTCKKFYVHVLY